MNTNLLVLALLATFIVKADDLKLNIKKVYSGTYDSVESQLVIKDGVVFALSKAVVDWGDDSNADYYYYTTEMKDLSVSGTEIFYKNSGAVCANIVEKRNKTIIKLTDLCKFKTRTVKVQVAVSTVNDDYDISDVCSFDQSKDLGLSFKTCKNNGNDKLTNDVNVTFKTKYSQKEYKTRKYDYFVLEVK